MQVTTSSVALKKDGGTCCSGHLISKSARFLGNMNCALFAALVVLCCCCALSVDARPARLRPRPLDNSETWNNIMVMAKHVSIKAGNARRSCTKIDCYRLKRVTFLKDLHFACINTPFLLCSQIGASARPRPRDSPDPGDFERQIKSECTKYCNDFNQTDTKTFMHS